MNLEDGAVNSTAFIPVFEPTIQVSATPTGQVADSGDEVGLAITVTADARGAASELACLTSAALLGMEARDGREGWHQPRGGAGMG